jgi:hypothetical protein
MLLKLLGGKLHGFLACFLYCTLSLVRRVPDGANSSILVNRQIRELPQRPVGFRIPANVQSKKELRYKESFLLILINKNQYKKMELLRIRNNKIRIWIQTQGFKEKNTKIAKLIFQKRSKLNCWRPGTNRIVCSGSRFVVLWPKTKKLLSLNIKMISMPP